MQWPPYLISIQSITGFSHREDIEKSFVYQGAATFKTRRNFTIDN